MSPFHIGDIVEAAAWFNGAVAKKKAMVAIRIAFKEVEQDVILAPIKWNELPPGSDRTPEPPPDAERGVMLMVGEAEVKAIRKVVVTGFISQLDPKDLADLRQITRKAYLKQNPGTTFTDHQCDEVIERIGPESVLKTLH